MDRIQPQRGEDIFQIENFFELFLGTQRNATRCSYRVEQPKAEVTEVRWSVGQGTRGRVDRWLGNEPRVG